MTVETICQRNVDTADALERVQSAAQRMDSRNVGTLIVLDGVRRPIGILTDRDIALRVVGRGRDPFATAVGDVMTAELETVLESVSVEEALKSMRARGVRRLPVTRASGELVGVVTLDDILAHLAQEFAVVGRLLEASQPGRDKPVRPRGSALD